MKILFVNQKQEITQNYHHIFYANDKNKIPLADFSLDAACGVKHGF